VTGASSGIGEAVARACAQRGDRVALLARRESELQRVVASLPRPEQHVVLTCDIADSVALAQSFARVAQEFGALDLLVNNAGVGYRALVAELDAELVRHLLDVNVTGLVMCCKHASPLLRRGRDPVVVNHFVRGRTPRFPVRPSTRRARPRCARSAKRCDLNGQNMASRCAR
jgi:NAD(P)-dependent dehydrogenase (short-subunit alcohol dehydrogenase family)